MANVIKIEDLTKLLEDDDFTVTKASDNAYYVSKEEDTVNLYYYKTYYEVHFSGRKLKKADTIIKNIKEN